MSNILIAAALLAIAVALTYVGRPAKNGESPTFLRFHAAVVIYPPIVLVFFAASIAAFIAGFSAIN